MSDLNLAGSVSQTLPTIVDAPPPVAPPPAPPVESNDPDFIALKKAREDVEAERGQSVTAPKADPAAPPAPSADPDPQAHTPKPRRQVVPKDRFDEVNAQARRLADENLYLKGLLEARTAGGTQPPAVQPTAPPSLVNDSGVRPITDADRAARMAQIAELEGQLDAIADKFDAGEISRREERNLARPLEAAIQAIRETDLAQFLLSSVPRPQAAPLAISDQQILDQQLVELTKAHPWSAVMSPEEIAYLRDEALREGAARGKPFGTGPTETLRLRKRIAELATKYGPDWYENQDPRTILGLPPQGQTISPQPAATRTPAPAPTNPALRNQIQHPPNVHQMGGPGAGTGEITEERILALSDDEIGNLPPAVRARILTGA